MSVKIFRMMWVERSIMNEVLKFLRSGGREDKKVRRC